MEFPSTQVRSLYEQLEAYLEEYEKGYWEAHEELPVFRIRRGRNSMNVQPGESDYARVGIKFSILISDTPNSPELNLWLLQSNTAVIGAALEIDIEKLVVLGYSIIQPVFSEFDPQLISRTVEYMDGVATLWRKEIISKFGGNPLPGPMPVPVEFKLSWDDEIRFLLLDDGDLYSRFQTSPGILHRVDETSLDGSPWTTLYDENKNYVAMLGYGRIGGREISVREPKVFAAGSPPCTLWDENREPRAFVIPRGCTPPFEAQDQYGRVVFREDEN